MTCAQGLLRLLWGGARSWSATGLNSKLGLVENREGKSTLYGVICCCDDRLLSRAVICGHTI